jgi:hypothetical protein
MIWIPTKYAPVMFAKVRKWVKIVLRSVAFLLLPSRVTLYDDSGAASIKIVLLQLSLCNSNTKHTVHWQSTSLSCGSILEVSYPINVFVQSISSLHLLHKIEVPKVGEDIISLRAEQVGSAPMTRY